MIPEQQKSIHAIAHHADFADIAMDVHEGTKIRRIVESLEGEHTRRYPDPGAGARRLAAMRIFLPIYQHAMIWSWVPFNVTSFIGRGAHFFLITGIRKRGRASREPLLRRSTERLGGAIGVRIPVGLAVIYRDG